MATSGSMSVEAIKPRRLGGVKPFDGLALCPNGPEERPGGVPGPRALGKAINPIRFNMFGRAEIRTVSPEEAGIERHRRVPEEQRGFCRGFRKGRPAAAARQEGRDRRLYGRAPESVSD